MDYNKQEVENRLIASKMFIRKEFMYLSMLMGRTRVVIDDSVERAATNGKIIMFNGKFVEGIDDKVLNFVMLHELLHIFLMHVSRQSFMGFVFEHKPHNFATDYVINGMIDDMNHPKITLMSGALFNTSYKGWSTEEVYADFISDWKKQKKMMVSMLSPSEQGDDSGGIKGSSSDNKTEKKSADDVGDLGHGQWGEMSDRDVSHAKQAIMEGILKDQEGFSTLPGSIRRAVLDGIDVSNQRDWRDVMKDFVFTAKSNQEGDDLQYEERLLGNDIYFIEDTLLDKPEDILFAVDNSGSIGDDQLKSFVENVVDCIETFDLGEDDNSSILVFNHEITGVWSLRDDGNDTQDILDFINKQPSGGTTFKPPYAYAESDDAEVQGVIMLTDGEGEYPSECNLPSLVILTGETGDKPPFGDYVYMREDD